MVLSVEANACAAKRFFHIHKNILSVFGSNRENEMENRMVVYVDVDDTLVRWVGTKRVPIPRVIGRIRLLHAEGATLYLWSTGGADYAEAIAGDLGIKQCFVGFLPKPALIIDDQAIQEWRDLIHERPI
jgi:cation transport ATPase